MAHTATATTVDVYELGGATLKGSGALREQLLDAILNMDPFDTPVLSSLPRTRARGPLDQWLKDTLPQPSDFDTGVVEGAEFLAFDMSSFVPTRDDNVTMIFRADLKVSETARVSEMAGFRDVYAYDVGKLTKGLSTKIESVLLDPAVVRATGTASAARVWDNFNAFLDTALTRENSGADPPTVITEEQFNDGLQQAFINGVSVRNLTIYAFPSTIRDIQSTFFGLAKTVSVANGRDALVNRRNVTAEQGTLIADVEFYRSPFGTVPIVVDRFMPTGTGMGNLNGRIYAIDRTRAAMAWLRPIAHTFLGRDGDSTRGTIVGEGTLRVLHEKAHFMWKSVDTG